MDNKIKMGVSVQGFPEKPKHFKGITYTKKSLTLDELIELIKQGHLFCHNYCNLSKFSMQDKTISNFSGTNLIWFDFDDCMFTIDELYVKSIIKPTIAYTTFSNTDKVNRFRFIYIFNEKIENADDYYLRTNLMLNLIFEKELTVQLINSKSIDKCSFNPSQQFLGSNPNCKLFYNQEAIITFKTVSNYFEKNNCNDDSKCFSNVINNANNIQKKYAEFYKHVNINQYVDCKCHDNSNSEKNKKEERIVLQNGKNMTEIIEKANEIVNNVRFIPTLNNFENVTYSKNVYTFVGDDNIYIVNTYFGKKKMIMEGKRNKAAYYQTNVILNINPTIKIEELVANLIWLRNKYFQNPETFTCNDIVNTALNVLNEHSENDMGKKKYVINPENAKTLSKTEKLKHLGEARRIKRDESILQNFDCSISVSKNAKFLGVSTSTIYNSIKYNYVNTKTENDFLIFKDMYVSTSEENRTIRKMAQIAEVNKGKSERYIRKIKLEQNNFENY